MDGYNVFNWLKCVFFGWDGGWLWTNINSEAKTLINRKLKIRKKVAFLLSHNYFNWNICIFLLIFFLFSLPETPPYLFDDLHTSTLCRCTVIMKSIDFYNSTLSNFSMKQWIFEILAPRKTKNPNNCELPSRKLYQWAGIQSSVL